MLWVRATEMTAQGSFDVTQKRIVIGIVVLGCAIGLWYGYLYGIRYYKEHAWARVPVTPAVISNSVQIRSLTCKSFSLLDDSCPLIFVSNERTPMAGEVEGDPKRWCNSLYASEAERSRSSSLASANLPKLYMRCRFWRSGGTMIDNEMNQSRLDLKRRDADSFIASGTLHAPRRPGQYELQIWAVERDPSDPNLKFSREFVASDVIVGRRVVTVQPVATTP